MIVLLIFPFTDPSWSSSSSSRHPLIPVDSEFLPSFSLIVRSIQLTPSSLPMLFLFFLLPSTFPSTPIQSAASNFQQSNFQQMSIRTAMIAANMAMPVPMDWKCICRYQKEFEISKYPSNVPQRGEHLPFPPCFGSCPSAKDIEEEIFLTPKFKQENNANSGSPSNWKWQQRSSQSWLCQEQSRAGSILFQIGPPLTDGAWN